MSEIKKMYKNAEVNRVCDTCELRGYKRLCPSKELCVRTNPPFTAEKQIELIKWLAKRDCMYRLTYERDFLWCSQLEWQSSFCYENFEESLANLINTLWQDLTEEEKQQVKGILE